MTAHLCDHLLPGGQQTTLTEKSLLFGGAIRLAGGGQCAANCGEGYTDFLRQLG